jgi:hypothetical protein
MKDALMKLLGNTVAFYTIVAIPLLVDIFYVSPTYGSTIFFIVLLVYIFLFRPFTDGFRLAAIGKIKSNEIWKMFIPFYSYILHYSRKSTV